MVVIEVLKYGGSTGGVRFSRSGREHDFWQRRLSTFRGVDIFTGNLQHPSF